jgi:quercetin dioxygenase-like cupin family protein
MKSWNLNDMDLKPHAPQILSSTDDARAIALAIPAGESLQDHQVHERAWVSILSGEAQITTTDGEVVDGTPGLLVEFDPRERHAVRAVSDTRLLLLLTPWPGDGHPGAMSLDDKATAVTRAAERRSQQSG